MLVIDSLRQECIFVRYGNNVKAGSVTDEERSTLASLADMQEIPFSDRVYPDCQHDFNAAVVIIYIALTIRANLTAIG